MLLPEQPAASAAVRPRPASAKPAAGRILVVDDTAAAAYMLGKLLEALGQQVQVAGSGTAALEALAGSEFNLVISDISMPGMDGFELARRIRERSRADVTLVALSGFSQEEDHRKSVDAGFDYHLVKPVGIDALRELLARTVSTSN